MKATFPVPDYLPDQTPNSGTLEGLTNGIPIVNGFGPVPAFQSVSSAITGDFLGGAAVISDDGTSYLLVGTSTHLLRYATGGWTTLLSGLTITDKWQFQGFGDFVVAVNGSTTYEVDLTAGTASAITGAPAGKSVAEVGGYIVIGQDTNKLINVATSEINDHTEWDVVEGATIQPLLAGGEVMGIAGGEFGVILQRRRIVRQSTTGDAALPFDYDAVLQDVGCASRGSVISWGRSVYFIADQGFMEVVDGQAINPIGTEAVDRTFQSLVPPDDYERIFSAIDPVRKLAIWCVPGSPGNLFIYNYELQKWGRATLNVQGIFSAFTSSETLEGVSTANPDLDAMTVSLDDPSFAGGSPQLYIVQDGEIGTLSGSALEMILELGFMEPSPGRRSRLRMVRGVTDAPSYSMTDKVSDRQGDVPVEKLGGSLRDSGRIPIRASGRYHRITFTIPADQHYEYFHAFEAEFDRGGER